MELPADSGEHVCFKGRGWQFWALRDDSVPIADPTESHRHPWVGTRTAAGLLLCSPRNWVFPGNQGLSAALQTGLLWVEVHPSRAQDSKEGGPRRGDSSCSSVSQPGRPWVPAVVGLSGKSGVVGIPAVSLCHFLAACPRLPINLLETRFHASHLRASAGVTAEAGQARRCSRNTASAFPRGRPGVKSRL